MSTSFVLPIDKPTGPTSHDIVAMARRALGTKHIGHTGTLDPFASGLLLLCVESATRLAEYFNDLPKRYRATARLDGTSLTDDVTGELSATSQRWRSLGEVAVRAAFARQQGTIQQTPSVFSAKKIGGERAYDLARRGDSVELAPVEVTVFDLNVIEINLPVVEFEVACSSGTYIRAIARDVGSELGTGGYLTELRRTAIGKFDVAHALSAEALADKEKVAQTRVSMLDAVAHMPVLEVSEDEERMLRFGQAILRAGVHGTLALARAGDLIAMAVGDGERIKPKKVFPRD